MVNPMNRFSQLQSPGRSHQPGGRRQPLATKPALGPNLAENTKLTETLSALGALRGKKKEERTKNSVNLCKPVPAKAGIRLKQTKYER